MSPQSVGHLAMLAFSALVAGSFALGVLVANEIAPEALNALRFLIAGTVLAVLAVLVNGFRRTYFEASWRYLFLGSVFAVYFVLMFYGLKTANPVSAAAVFTLTPIMSAGFGFLLLRQITNLKIAFALLIGAMGALWVIFDGSISALLAMQIGRGEQIFFVGCICHALYTPLVKKLNRGEPALVFTALTIAGGLLAIVFVGFDEILATPWSQLPAWVYWIILYISIGASAFTFFLLQLSAMRLPASKVMAYTYLTPSWVILWQVVLGTGLPGPHIFVGVALTCLALILLLKE